MSRDRSLIHKDGRFKTQLEGVEHLALIRTIEGIQSGRLNRVGYSFPARYKAY